jgi:hypothetical protein
MQANRFVGSVVAVVALLGVREARAGIWPNGVQSNGIQSNGIQSNGIQSNGIQSNGIQSNGIQSNGIQSNGIQSNGIQTSGVTFNGIQLNGTQMTYIGQSSSVYPYSCAHREDVTGAPLNDCSACSMIVGDADSYCQSGYWDSICVNEAKSMCTLGAGTVLTASFTDGRTARMRIDAVTQGSSSFWNGTQYVDMSDVYYDNVSWVLDHAPNVTGTRLLGGANSCTNQVCNVGGNGYAPDPYCCTSSWDSYCVAEANAECGATTGTTDPSSTFGASVCGYTGTGLRQVAVKAVLIPGVWNQGWGFDGGGDKSASTTSFTIACRGVGAYAKCLDMGYKSWKSAAQDALHQTCVRMVRADYCGDGNSFTQTGHGIDVQDYFASSANQIQAYSPNSTWNYEASWNPQGARFADHYRTAYQGSAYDGTPVNQYVGSRSSYCHIESPWSGPMNAQADGTVNLIVNRAQ